jgi:hypothetical protein
MCNERIILFIFTRIYNNFCRDNFVLIILTFYWNNVFPFKIVPCTNNVDPSGVPGREGIGNVVKNPNVGVDSVGELGCALDAAAGFSGC